MSDYETYLTKADELKNNKDYERAVEIYLKALDFKPTDYETLEKIADSYFCLSNFEKAIACYQKSLIFNSEYILALVGISKTCELTHKLDKSIDYLEKAFELSNLNTDIALQLMTLIQQKTKIIIVLLNLQRNFCLKKILILILIIFII